MRLSEAAKYDLLVITDNDVRVRPNYLRTVIAPFRDPKVGGGTCLYRSTREASWVQVLQSVGMISDFFAGIMVAWKLEEVNFTFGQTILARREAIQKFGGYQVLESRPADDFLVGRMIAEQGYQVVLLPYVVEVVADFDSFKSLLFKRVRWMTVMRMMRPWGHFGLVFTWGLPWAIWAIAVHPTRLAAAGYLGGYAFCRVLITWLVGKSVLHSESVWQKMPWIALWDLTAFFIWLASFARRSIRWRGLDYSIHNGLLRLRTSATARNRTP